MFSKPIRDRRFYEERDRELAAFEARRENAAKQAEYQHYANRSRLDNDELRASCGIGPTNFGEPPRRR